MVSCRLLVVLWIPDDYIIFFLNAFGYYVVTNQVGRGQDPPDMTLDPFGACPREVSRASSRHVESSMAREAGRPFSRRAPLSATALS